MSCRLARDCSAQGAEVFVNSSAAGGLRMTVHGLTRSMTVRAANEAALGAGALVKYITSGRLGGDDLQEIVAIHPNIILLAGGVDYGDQETVLYNARQLAIPGPAHPGCLCRQPAARPSVQTSFSRPGSRLCWQNNVFPDVDVLNIEPVRRLVHEVFNRHIIHAPGMQRLGELTRFPVHPHAGRRFAGSGVIRRSARRLPGCGCRRRDH